MERNSGTQEQPVPKTKLDTVAFLRGNSFVASDVIS